MAKKADDQGNSEQSAKAGEAREARLSSGLRDNLKRRKSQARARDEAEAPGRQSRKDRKTLIDPV